MYLENLSSQPDPVGNKIFLSWNYPEGTDITGVYIRRKTRSYPVSIDDGEIVAVETDATSYIDTGLKGNTVYYYSFFPYVDDPANIIIDRHNRTHAMATMPMEYSRYMYELLPSIYHRYDKTFPGVAHQVEEADREKGQLQRFIDIIGGQLDLLHSHAKALEYFHAVQKVDGSILPLLAQWIGWKLDLKQELDIQRNEVSNAPDVYKSVGIIPVIQHTVKRISDWESLSKEFVHNVFLTNRPERLNFWSLLRDASGVWSTEQQLFSLDYAFDGRPSFTEDNNQVRWLFYHTQRNDQWEIWYKTSPTYSLSLRLLDQLSVGVVADSIKLALQEFDIYLAADSVVTQDADLWHIDDASNSESYLVEQGTDVLSVYHLSADPVLFSPSKPLIRSQSINKYSSSGMEGSTLWLFWSEYDSEIDTWKIHYRHHINGAWLETDYLQNDNSPFRNAGVVDTSASRYKPSCVVDREANLWLFWLEKSAGRWQMKYNKRTGGNWGANAITLPLESRGQFRVDSYPGILMSAVDTGPQIYVFWSRNVASGVSDQTRWQINFQVKTDLILDESNWHGVYTHEKDPGDDDYHDREPIAVINSTNDIELFWTSNQSGNWSIWSRILTSVDTTTDTVTWGESQQVTPGFYSNRDALPLSLSDNRLLLLSRSNKSPHYTSESYQAMSNLDQRYAGCTTQHVRNVAKWELTGEFEDFVTYTYDAGTDGVRDDRDRYARDTVGIYLNPDTMDEEIIEKEIERLKPVVKEFMPITDRAVYIPKYDLHTDRVYTYGLPPSPDSRFIVSIYQDEFTSVMSEAVLGPGEDFVDTLT